MQITGLPQSGAFTGTDVLAIEINGVTYKLDGATLATAIVSIGSLVTGVKGNNEGTYRTGNVNITPANVGALAPSDVVNNLTSTSTTAPLSAAQGKELNAKFGGAKFYEFVLGSNTPRTITVSNAARSILFFSSAYISCCGCGALAHYGQGKSDGITWFSQPSNITVNVSTNNSIVITAVNSTTACIMALEGTYTI